MMWDWISDFDLFLFDFDGLLVDSEPFHYQAFSLLCEERGVPIDWDFKTYCSIAHAGGFSLRDRMYELYPNLEQDYSDWLAFYKHKEPYFIQILKENSMPFLSGAEALLENLNKEKKDYVVVTHSKRAWVEAIKEHLPLLEKVPLWLTREDYVEPKPSPEGFLKAIKAFDMMDKRVIGFEDAPRGIRALQETPAKRVLIQREKNLDQAFFEDPNFYFCTSLEEVGEALASKHS